VIINSLLLLLLLFIIFIYIYCCYLLFITTVQGISIFIYRCAHSNDKNGFDVLLNCNFLGKKLNNTRCYLCSHLIHSLPSLRECTGIKIVGYDFSDPQAGKDLCDRRIATVQSHVRCNINEGTTLKVLVISYGGLKGVRHQ